MDAPDRQLGLENHSIEFFEWLKKRLFELQAEKEELISGFTNKKTGFVYFIKSTLGNFKIGRSSDPDLRLKQLQSDPASKLIIVHKIRTDDMVKLEALVHEVFSFRPNERIEREWFNIDENHETFQQWLSFENFDYWDEYGIDIALIDNNLRAYQKLIVDDFANLSRLRE